MKKKTLSDKQWAELCKGFWKQVTQHCSRGRGSAKALAKALGTSPQMISDMRAGRSLGSVLTNTRMLFVNAGISEAQAKKILQNPNIVLKEFEEPSQLDEMFQEIKNLYSENELSAWLRLLKDKKVVEKHLNISVKAALKKK